MKGSLINAIEFCLKQVVSDRKQLRQFVVVLTVMYAEKLSINQFE